MRIRTLLTDLAYLVAPAALTLGLLVSSDALAAERARLHQSEIPWDARCAARASEPGGIQDSGYCRTLAAKTFGCTPIFAPRVNVAHPDSRVHAHRGSGKFWSCNPAHFQRGMARVFARFGG